MTPTRNSLSNESLYFLRYGRWRGAFELRGAAPAVYPCIKYTNSGWRARTRHNRSRIKKTQDKSCGARVAQNLPETILSFVFAVHAGGVGCRHDTQTHKWDRRPTHESRHLPRVHRHTEHTHTMYHDKRQKRNSIRRKSRTTGLLQPPYGRSRRAAPVSPCPSATARGRLH